MNKRALNIFAHNIVDGIKYFFVSDESFNRKWYKKKFGIDPDFEHPKSYSEKLQYIKMHYYNPLMTVCADKFAVMDYVRQCGYPEILKEVYYVANTFEEIKWDKLPDKFFIQCSHTQGNNYVVDKSDKNKINEIKEVYRQLLHRKHYKILRENCYKNIQPKIICAEYLTEPGRDSLTDYKIYCFGGKAMYFMVSYGEFTHNVKNHKFDMEWNSIDHLFKREEAVNPSAIPHPTNFKKMVEIAEKLSAPFPHARIDLYNIEGRIVFGEITFFSAGGFVNVYSKEMDSRIASQIKLEEYNNYMIERT